MLKIEYDGKKYEIPQSFEELTLEQYCKAFYKLPKIEEDMDKFFNDKKIQDFSKESANMTGMDKNETEDTKGQKKESDK